MSWARTDDPLGWHTHNEGSHAHQRADEEHRHKRNAKTYFRGERRSDGMPITKCEGHWSVDLDVLDDWAYPKGAFTEADR
jgi:hypothetical protein